MSIKANNNVNKIKLIRNKEKEGSTFYFTLDYECYIKNKMKNTKEIKKNAFLFALHLFNSHLNTY